MDNNNILFGTAILAACAPIVMMILSWLTFSPPFSEGYIFEPLLTAAGILTEIYAIIIFLYLMRRKEVVAWQYGI